MGVKLVDLKRDQRTVVIPIPVGEADGVVVTEDLTVTYRPSAYTGKTEQELNALSKEEWKSEMGLSFINRLVISWDLEGEDGAVFALDIESLATLPTTFIGDVIQGVAQDMGKARAN